MNDGWAKGLLISLWVSGTALGAAQSTYRIGESNSAAEVGPVRMARISYESGPVEWRATEKLGWSRANYNLPMRQGAQVWVPSGGRCELQFDDGSDLRLAPGSLCQLSTLYSDDQGEFTEIQLNNGLATFHLMNGRSVYQIDTPTAAVKAYGPAEVRVGDTSGLEVAVQGGQAVVDGRPGKLTLETGQYVDITDPNAQYAVRPVPGHDDWDNFNSHRDAVCYRAHRHLPHTLALTANNLDDYGTWHDDPRYGEVWSPREDPNWRPYRDGSWTWVSPFGWTWVANEPWGWDPYHYGTWRHERWGWSWVPGPAYQPWSPAVVDFSYYNGNVAWCALDPSEVSYPASFSVGFGFGNWGFSFAIGSAATYYPVGAYCAPYAWNNGYANGFASVYTPAVIVNYYNTDPLLARSFGRGRFFPANFRYGGATYASANGFAYGGHYAALAPSRAAFFRQGHSYVDPPSRVGPLSGPFNVRPTRVASFTPSRSFSGHGPQASVANRSVYRGTLPSAVARHSGFAGSTQRAPAMGRFTAQHPAPMNRIAGKPQGFTGTRPNSGRPMGANLGVNRYNQFNRVSHSQFTLPSGTGRSAGSFQRPTRPRNRTAPAHTAPRRTGSNPRATGGRPAAANPGANRYNQVTRPARTGRPTGSFQRPTRPQNTAPRRPSSSPRATTPRGGAGSSFNRPARPAAPATHRAPAPRRTGGGGFNAPRSNRGGTPNFPGRSNGGGSRNFGSPRGSLGGGGRSPGGLAPRGFGNPPRGGAPRTGGGAPRGGGGKNNNRHHG